MASLGLSAYHASGADIAPRIEYNAKSGRLSIVNRAQGPDGAFASDKTDVTMSKPQFALDIGSIEIGWILFPPATGPQTILVPFGEPMPGRPDRAYKAGFALKVWDGREPMWRRFMSNAGVVVQAIEELWDEVTATVQAASGDIPVARFMDVLPISGRQGTNYAPVFHVTRWIQRDERIFGPRTVPPIGESMVRPPAAPAPRAALARQVAAPPPAAWDAVPDRALAPASVTRPADEGGAW